MAELWQQQQGLLCEVPGILKAPVVGGTGGTQFDDKDFLVSAAVPVLIEVRRAGNPLGVTNLTTVYATSDEAARALAVAMSMCSTSLLEQTDKQAADALKATSFSSGPSGDSQGQLAELSNGCSCAVVDGVSATNFHPLVARGQRLYVTSVQGEWKPSLRRPRGAIASLSIQTGRACAGPRQACALVCPEPGPLPAKPLKGSFLFQAPTGFAISAFHGRKGWSLDALGVYMTAAVPRTWAPETNHQYPDDFKAGVRALLLCANRLRKGKQTDASSSSSSVPAGEAPSGLGQLPRAALENIVQQLNLLSYHTFERVEDAGYGPVAEQPHGARAQCQQQPWGAAPQAPLPLPALRVKVGRPDVDEQPPAPAAAPDDAFFSRAAAPTKPAKRTLMQILKQAVLPKARRAGKQPGVPQMQRRLTDVGYRGGMQNGPRYDEGPLLLRSLSSRPRLGAAY